MIYLDMSAIICRSLTRKLCGKTAAKSWYTLSDGALLRIPKFPEWGIIEMVHITIDDDHNITIQWGDRQQILSSIESTHYYPFIVRQNAILIGDCVYRLYLVAYSATQLEIRKIISKSLFSVPISISPDRRHIIIQQHITTLLFQTIQDGSLINIPCGEPWPRILQMGDITLLCTINTMRVIYKKQVFVYDILLPNMTDCYMIDSVNKIICFMGD